MHLPRERNRRERSPGECKPPAIAAPRPLERPERKREEDGDRPEHVADALLHPVRRDSECQTTCQRRPPRQIELSQPRARREACEHIEEELQDVPAADEAEHGAERPEEDPVRPAGEVRLRLRLRTEGVRVPPGRATVFELVADEPVVVQRLQMVARRGFAVSGRSAREEVRAGVEDGRPRRGCPGREVERSAERYKACAARRSSSKSGTSAVS